jgi:hypothetical protein
VIAAFLHIAYQAVVVMEARVASRALRGGVHNDEFTLEMPHSPAIMSMLMPLIPKTEERRLNISMIFIFTIVFCRKNNWCRKISTAEGSGIK